MAAKPLSPTQRSQSESPAAWHAFTLYRDLGVANRSLTEVTRRLAAEKTGTGLRIVGPETAPKQPKEKSGQVGAWSRKFQWIARAAAWDAILDARLREKQLDAIEKMAARHASQADIILQDLMAPAVAFARAMRDPNRAVVLESASLPELFKMLAFTAMQVPRVQKAERLARGVKVVDTEPVSNPASTQSPAEWRISIHQPERSEAPPELTAATTQEAEEWEEA